MNKTSEIQLQKETLRIETFSDGVFCIAVTLLSIEIGVDAASVYSPGNLGCIGLSRLFIALKS